MGGGVVVKDFGECGYFEARDGCMLAEAMHPARETLPFTTYCSTPQGTAAQTPARSASASPPAYKVPVPERIT